MDRGRIIKELAYLAWFERFNSVCFDFDREHYVIFVASLDDETITVDVSCFPDFDDGIDIRGFSDEFLLAFYRAVCDKLNLIDKNLF